MTNYQFRNIPIALGAMFAFSITVAACGGGVSSSPPLGSTAPTAGPGNGGGTSVPTAPPTGGPTTRPTATPTIAPTATPTIAPQACNVSGAPIPGTYTSVVMTGNISGGAFTLGAGSAWLREMYTLATPAPSPTPTTVPTASPTPGQPLYVYSGIYNVKRSNGVQEPTGCAFLVTTQSGAPIANNYNATIGANPIFKQPVNATFVGTGAVASVSLTNLGGSGGSGTFALDDGSTGTLNFSSRIVVASFEIHR